MQDFKDVNHVFKVDIYIYVIPITLLGDAWFKLIYKVVLFERLLVYICQNSHIWLLILIHIFSLILFLLAKLSSSTT